MSMNGTSQRVRGGWRVSGRWQPASGILHAQWVLPGVPVEADHALALIPVCDVRIGPTWSVSGLQGNGSETVEVDDVFVVEDRIMSMAKAAGGYASQRPDEPFATIPVEALCATTVVAPLLGMAEAAVAQAVDAVRKRGAIAGTGDPRAADSPAVRMKVATAASLVDSAWLHANRAVEDVTATMRARRSRRPSTHAGRRTRQSS
jgi:3-hydroxy-9,10-secoandrosta-1,3,5(10)-triene-9,17-dione monooxygenase